MFSSQAAALILVPLPPTLNLTPKLNIPRAPFILNKSNLYVNVKFLHVLSVDVPQYKSYFFIDTTFAFMSVNGPKHWHAIFAGNSQGSKLT